MSKKSPETIDDIILKIHAAPMEPHGWQIVMRSLMDLCEAPNALMLTVGATQLPSIKSWEPSLNFDPSALREYATHWSSEDLLYLGARAKGRIRPGLVSTETELVGREEYRSSAYFNEFCKPHNLYSHLNLCLSGAVPQLGLAPSAITLYRDGSQDAFGHQQAEFLQRLAPHLSIAARTSWHIESLGMAALIYRRALDEIRLPLFALDLSGNLAMLNSAADSLVRAKRWVSIIGNSLVASRGLLKSGTFRQALAKLRSGLGTTLLLTDGSSRQEAIMTTVPFVHSSPIQVGQHPISGFIWIVPCAPEITPAKSLGTLFELTPAEIRLLQKLVSGVHLKDAAAQLHVTLNTARTQLKAIFRKSGRRTQGQLVSLANRMAIVRTQD